jgi:Protein of unknown function (DUF3667)
MDSGFFFTSLQMVRNPGDTVRQFIAGKRKTYQSPISYFLIWITIYILSLYTIEKIFGENVVINYREYFGPASATKFAISHLSLVLVFVIPFQALYLYLLVTKYEYNYIETLVATIYCLGTIILFQFLFALFALLIYGITGASVDLRISDILKILYLGWFIAHFIKPFRVTHHWLRITAFVFLAFGTFTIWRLYGFPWLMGIFYSKN